jgi:hypothetical protein
MMGMKVFDCDIAYGRSTTGLPQEIETVSEILREMDHCGIDEALVWHHDARDRDFNLGNRRLKELETSPRLYPTKTFVPAFSDEMCDVEVFFDSMRKDDVRAARAFPTSHNYLLNPLSCGPVFERLIAHAIPLFVPLAEFPLQWQGVYDLLASYPALKLVVTETGCWGQDRYFRPLLARYPGFHLTTHRLETAGQLKEVVDRYGPERILFGSGLPGNYPGAYILMLTRTDIPLEAKEAIAYGNLKHMLEEVTW